MSVLVRRTGAEQRAYLEGCLSTYAYALRLDGLTEALRAKLEEMRQVTQHMLDIAKESS